MLLWRSGQNVTIHDAIIESGGGDLGGLDPDAYPITIALVPPPGPIPDLTLQAQALSPTSIQVWGNSIGQSFTEVYLSDSYVGQLQDGTLVISGLSEQTTYEVYLRAINNFGNVLDTTEPITVTTPAFPSTTAPVTLTQAVSVSDWPPPVVQNDSISLAFTIQNTGPQAVTLIGAVKQMSGSSLVNISSYSSTPVTIQPGASHTFSGSLFLAQTGSFTLKSVVADLNADPNAWLDCSRVSSGINETTAQTVVSANDLRPELVVFGLFYDAATNRVYGNIQNSDWTQDVTKPFLIYLEVQGQRGQTIQVNSLAHTQLYEFNFYLDNMTTGTKLGRLVIDPYNTVQEYDETNNVATLLITPNADHLTTITQTPTAWHPALVGYYPMSGELGSQLKRLNFQGSALRDLLEGSAVSNPVDGNGYNFPGGQNSYLLAPGLILGQNDWTYVLSFRVDSFNTPWDRQYLFFQGNSNLRLALAVFNATGQLKLMLLDTQGRFCELVTDQSLVLGQTYQANCVKEGDWYKLYLNGQLVKRASGIEGRNFGWDDLSLGAYVDGTNGQLQGWLSNLEIYGQALTPEEIASNYNQLTGSNVVALPEPEPDETLVAHYQFNGPLGSLAKRQNAQFNQNLGLTEHGNLLSVPGHDGVTDGAYRFSGLSAQDYLYAKVADQGNFGAGDFSLSGWFKQDQLIAGNSSHIIIGKAKNGNPNQGYAVQVNATTGRLEFVLRNNTPEQWVVTSINPVTLNVWHHFAAVRLGDTMYLYLNGVCQQTLGGLVGQSFDCSDPLTLGIHYETAVRQQNLYGAFAGTIDEVKVWRKALSSIEVSNDYLGVVEPDPTPAPTPTPTPTPTPVPSPTPDPRLITVLLMNGAVGSSEKKADSVGSANLTEHSSLTSVVDRFGQADKAYGLANAYLQGPSEPFNFGLNNFASSVWFNTSRNTAVPGSFMGLVTKMWLSGANDGWHIRMEMLETANKGKLQFVVHEQEPDHYHLTIFSQHAFNDGGWHQGFVVRQGDVISLYVDGVLEATATGAANCLISNPDPLVIGAITPSPSIDNPFYGSIDEVKIFNAALSAAEIAAMYAADLGLSP